MGIAMGLLYWTSASYSTCLMEGHYDGVINEGRQSGVNIWVLPRARGSARAQARAIKQESPTNVYLIMSLYLLQWDNPTPHPEETP